MLAYSYDEYKLRRKYKHVGILIEIGIQCKNKKCKTCWYIDRMNTQINCWFRHYRHTYVFPKSKTLKANINVLKIKQNKHMNKFEDSNKFEILKRNKK